MSASCSSLGLVGADRAIRRRRPIKNANRTTRSLIKATPSQCLTQIRLGVFSKLISSTVGELIVRSSQSVRPSQA